MVSDGKDLHYCKVVSVYITFAETVY